jgi:SAM-dependent methyltransferase
MTLADTSSVLDLPSADCRALRDRLRRAGLRRGAIKPFSGVCERLPDAMRGPMRRWHLRRERTPLTLAARMFVFMDPVPRDEANELLGDLLPRLLDHGLVVEREGGLVCPFLLNLVNDAFILCDDLGSGGDAVMGAGGTTADLIHAAYPRTRKKSALDVGCGAGTAALLLASEVDRAVGVDINPRAIVLSKLNARLNGIENVEFFCGDLFAPVAGETFDLIVSQPPFVSVPDEGEQVTFLHGGRRGDEITMRMLAELPAHLAPGGRAVVLLDYPQIGDDTPASRVRGAIGNGPDALLLVSSPKDLDEYCTFYAAERYPALGPEFERQAMQHRAHLAGMAISELRFVFVILDHTPVQNPWTASIEIGPLSEVQPGSAQVDRLVGAQQILARDDAAFLQAELRAVEGMRFVDDGDRIVARLPPRSLIPPVACSMQAAQLVSAFGAGMTVDAALSAFAGQLGAAREALRPQFIPGVRQALTLGLLETKQ